MMMKLQIRRVKKRSEVLKDKHDEKTNSQKDTKQ